MTVEEVVSPEDPETPDPAPDHEDDDEIVQEPGENVSEGAEGGDEEQTFPRAYVETLRRENAALRTRAADRDDLHFELLAARIHQAAGPVLEDPESVWTDHELSDFTDDEGRVSANLIRRAADEVAKAHPNLARRRPTGDIDQGARTDQPEPVSLAAKLREAAG